MNALRLYHDLKARGVVLEGAGESLKVDAPAGVLTEEDRSALAEFKPALLKFLARQGRPSKGGENGQNSDELNDPNERRFRARRSRHPGFTSLYDPTADEWHDFPTQDCFPSIVAEAGKRRREAAGA